MTPQDSKSLPKKDRGPSEAKGDGQLRQVLGGTSKSINYSNISYENEANPTANLSPSPSDITRGSVGSLNIN